MEIKQIGENFRRFEVIKTIIMLSYRLVNKIIFFKVLIGMTLEMDNINWTKLSFQNKNDYKYCFLNKDQLMRFIKDVSNNISTEFFTEAMAKGDRCYGIIDRDKLASYCWYSVRPTKMTNDLVLDISKGFVYQYKNFTRNEYRGHRLDAIRSAKGFRIYSKQGYKGMIAYVELENFGSMRSLFRTGFRAFGKIVVTKLFRRYLIYKTKGCKNYGFDLTVVRK